MLDLTMRNHSSLIFPVLTTGSGSAGRRKTLVIDLMRSCREMELKFLVRALDEWDTEMRLVRNLRIGATMRTILPALAHAVVLHSCSPSEPVFISEALKTQMQ
ncbi:hypothetical protein ACMD2_22971, partial [Ananas comosus]